MEKEENLQAANLIHNFEDKKSSFLISMKFLSILLVVVILGGLTGFIISKNNIGENIVSKGSSSSSVEKGTTMGSNDLKTFKDSTEGVLKEGGIDGEGQYHLVRPGGDSQNVYLTSSIVDLSKLLDKKIKVWGETQKAQKAGWLMDVGKVEVLD